MLKKYIAVLLCAVLCCAVLGGCSNSKTDPLKLLETNGVLITFGGEYEVTRDMLLYYMLGYRTSTDNGDLSYWEGEDDLAQQLIAYVVNNFRYQYAMLKWAEDCGITISEGDYEAADKQIDSYIALYGSEEAFVAALNSGYSTLEVYRRLIAEDSVISQLSDYIYADGSEYVTVTQQDIADFIANGEPLYKAKRILIHNEDGDDTEANRQLALNILQQLWDGADFDTLMNKYSEDPGLSSNPDGYLFGEGEMVAVFENTVADLGFNEISGVVESSYGYHIILRLEPTKAEYSEKIIKARISEKLDEYCLAAEIKYADGFESIALTDYYWPYDGEE